MTLPSKTIIGGLLVLFEGMDGTGKTTQLQALAKHLRTSGWAVQTTRGHGGTPIGEALRVASLADISRPAATDMHISLAMHAGVIEQVNLWRQQGFIVLVDRGPLSIVAYQGYGDGLDLDIVWREVTTDYAGFNPDVCVVYTAAVDVALNRAKQKPGGGSDYFESKATDYFQKVNAGYLEAAERFEATVIDSTPPLLDVFETTLAVIEKVLANKTH